MIKSLVRWGKTLGIGGSALLGSMMIGNLAAQALPEEQVLKQLNPVPVFTVINEEGSPVVTKTEDQKQVTGVFFSQSDATKFVEKIKQNDPELAKQVKIAPISLGEIYKLAESAEIQENELTFYFQPQAEAVTSAKAIGEANQKPYEGGVPLFVAKSEGDKGYLVIEQDSQQIIPFFFDKKQLENMVAEFKEQKPDVAGNVDIEVLPLEGVIETLATTEDKMWEKIVLVPSAESIQFLQNNAPASGTEGATPAPAATPEAAPAE